MSVEGKKYQREPRRYGLVVVTALIGLNILTIFGYILGRAPIQERVFEILICVVVLFVLNLLYFSKSRVEKIRIKYGEETSTQKIVSRILVNFYVVVSMILFYVNWLEL